MKNINQKYRILIVDDSVDNLQLLSHLLEDEGYITLQATNGRLGLDIAGKARPALILLDIKMPGMDGYEVCRQLKKIEGLMDIPVIFISGLNSQIDKVKAFGVGGVDYITRPIQTDEVLARINVQIELLTARNELEQRVLERTASLAEANLAIKVEIAEHQKTINALRDNQEIFSLFISQSPIHSYIKEVSPTSSHVLMASENFKDMIGCPGSEMIGKTMDELFPAEFAAKITADDWKVVSDGKILNLEEDLNGRNYATVKFPIYLENRVMLAGYTIDITKQKQAEVALTEAKEKAEESDRLKSAFLTNMSHEIRTPMNGILGFSSLLKEPDLTGDQQQQYIEYIEKSGNRMLNIISEIMDISKIESGQMDVHLMKTNINEIVEHVCNLLNNDAETKSLNLSFKNSLPVTEAVIITDQEKLYSILTNLVKNAIKYTDKGSVGFGYNKKESYFEFYVKDTGIGIPEDRQKAIFERFIQADIGDIQARQGAGLGLSIAKAFVELLGGKIWLESEPGTGSTFYFTIPVNLKSEEKMFANNIDIAMEKESRFKKVKILIVEDEETSAMYISAVVNIFSDNILYAKTGIEAVEVCKNNPDIGLILMDIRMPDTNGYEATRQIRQFNTDVVIIAQTAFAMVGDMEKAIAAGCNHYITKPINRKVLIETIQKYIIN